MCAARSRKRRLKESDPEPWLRRGEPRPAVHGYRHAVQSTYTAVQSPYGTMLGYVSFIRDRVFLPFPWQFPVFIRLY